MRNDTQMYFGPVNVAAEMRAAGKIGILAVATTSRVPTMKDVPTIAEFGLPGFSYDAWFGIMAPANTPADIISRLNAEIGAVLDRADIRDMLQGTGALPVHDTAADFNSIIAKDVAKLAAMFPAGIR